MDSRIIGILGGSGAGKSSLAAALVARLGEERTAVLSQDAYYEDLSHLRPEEREEANFDAPEALDLALLADHLQTLRAGGTVRPPAYDMRTHTRAGPGAPVAPAPAILVEGTLLLAGPRVAEALDAVVYVELSDEERLARRIARDVAVRGRTEASVRRRWERTVLPLHRRFVAPARARADLVVSGAEPPEVAAGRVAAALLPGI